MTNKEAVGRIVAASLDRLRDDLADVGLVAKGLGGPWRLTVILRNVDIDGATAVCGQDDEATLIVALQMLGAARGRSTHRVNADGITPSDD